MNARGAHVRWVTANRIVFPGSAQPDREALYVHGGEIRSRSSLAVHEAECASLATYFGAFPAAYWAWGTPVRQVRLALRVEGAVDVIVRATDVSGNAATLHRSENVTGEWSQQVAIGLDTGWVWCEFVGRAATSDVRDATWQVPNSSEAKASLTVCITTFNRERDCIRLLERIASDPHVFARIDRVVVADQGSRRLSEAAGFAAAAQGLGARLRVIVQPNLGGSGGFSRGMIEAMGEGSSHALLLDDDVDLEPESVSRLLAFAESSTGPGIVGAHMLSLTEPTRLHSYGERVAKKGFWWGPVDPSLSGIDLAEVSIENEPKLSRRVDVDFNGWWMCLVPIPVVRAIGASLPFFIKWDDAEYGLRAAAQGARTVTLPGAALWHMPWTAKDDGLDWQAYFQLRNRLVTALLHGRRRGGGVLSSSFLQDANHIVCAQYGSAALRNLALRDVLLGPAHLDPVLHAGPARASAVLAREGQILVSAPEVPDSSARPAPIKPRGAVASVTRVLAVARHQLRVTGGGGVEVHLPREGGKWWSLGLLDAAVVDAAAGNGAFVFRRDRKTAARALRRAILLRWQLWWRWPNLARQYRQEMHSSSSSAAWSARFTGRSTGIPRL